MKLSKTNMKTNSVTKIFGTIAIGGTLIATLLMSSNARAANCELPNGKAIDGSFIQSTLVEKSKSNGGIMFETKQNGCELRVAVHEFWMESNFDFKTGKVKTFPRKTSGGTWIFDLSGKKKAVIPTTYILNNSSTEASAKMTKSLEIYTTLQEDGYIAVKALFNVESDGTIIKMQAEASLIASMSPITAYMQSNVPHDFTARIFGAGPIKFQVVMSPELAAQPNSRYRVIMHGANWLLGAFAEQLSSFLRIYDFAFYRR